MLSWATKRQLLYLAIVLGVFLVVISFPIFSFFNKPATCFDGKQNQDELGIDCGGSCPLLCPFEVADPIVLWSRALEARLGTYDAVALIENPNVSAGVEEASYFFKVYDSNNILIVEREGKTRINPNDRLVVLESGLATGERLPARTLFEFRGELKWIRTEGEKPLLRVEREALDTTQTQPRLKATLLNQSLEDLEDVVVTVLLYDKNDNVIAVSKTEVEILPRSASKDIVFLFPQSFLNVPVRIDIIPQLNAISTN